MGRTVDRKQVEAFAEILGGLPSYAEFAGTVSREEFAAALADLVRERLAEGWPAEKLVEVLRERGLPVGRDWFLAYCRRLRVGKRGKSSVVQARTSAGSKTGSKPQTSAGSKGRSKPGSGDVNGSATSGAADEERERPTAPPTGKSVTRSHGSSNAFREDL